MTAWIVFACFYFVTGVLTNLLFNEENERIEYIMRALAIVVGWFVVLVSLVLMDRFRKEDE